MLVPSNCGCVGMVLTGIRPISTAPMGTPCILHNFSMSIPTAMLNIRQPIGYGAWHNFSGQPPTNVNDVALSDNCSLDDDAVMVGLLFLHL